MSSNSKSIADFLSLGLIQNLARPADFRYGQVIHNRGGVEFIEREPSHILAWVGGFNGTVAEGGSQRRRTQLFIQDEDLKWHCAGNPKNHQVFCKHCVALALTILNESRQ